MIAIRALTEADRPWAAGVETESWGEPVVARLGELIDPAELPGLVALVLELYQRFGMEIVALHRHAVTEARRSLKPSIPQHAANGIRIAHELELELRLPVGG